MTTVPLALGVNVDALEVGTGEKELLGVRDPVEDKEVVGESGPDREAVALGVASGELEGVLGGLKVDARVVGIEEVLRVRDTVEEVDREGVRLAGLVVAMGVKVTVALGEGVDSPVGVMDTVRVLVAVLALVVGMELGERVKVGEEEAEGEREGVREGVRVGVTVAAFVVGMEEGLGDTEVENVPALVVGMEEAVKLPVADKHSDAVFERVATWVEGIGLRVTVKVMDPVDDTDKEGVRVVVMEGVKVAALVVGMEEGLIDTEVENVPSLVVGMEEALKVLVTEKDSDTVFERVAAWVEGIGERVNVAALVVGIGDSLKLRPVEMDTEFVLVRVAALVVG